MRNSFFCLSKTLNNFFFLGGKRGISTQKRVPLVLFSLLSFAKPHHRRHRRHPLSRGRALCNTQLNICRIQRTTCVHLQFSRRPRPERARAYNNINGRRRRVSAIFRGIFHPFKRVTYNTTPRDIDDAIIFYIGKRVLLCIFDTFVETDGACRPLFAQFQ